METAKAGDKCLAIAYVFFNDTLWTVFYILNVLYALGKVMVRYNYSSVADSNPISVALHSGFYLICSMLVYILCRWAKFARNSVMEILYFGLKLFVFCPQFSENFSYLLAARVICILAGVVISFILLKSKYRKIDKRYNISFAVTIPVVILSLILFLVVYHEYVKLMIWGAFLVVACWYMFSFMNIPIEGAESVDGDTRG